MENSDPSKPPTWLELQRVCQMGEVTERTTLSPDSVKRHYGDYVVRLSSKRCGMKLEHVLAIANGTLQPRRKRRAAVWETAVSAPHPALETGNGVSSDRVSPEVRRAPCRR